MITRLIGVFIFLFPLFVSAQSEIFFQHTLSQAKEEQKPILIVFTGSDWCTSCITFKKEVLDHTEYSNQITEKYLVHIADFPRADLLSKEKIQDNENLAEKFNPQGIFPYIIAVDSNLKTAKSVSYKKGEAQYFLKQVNLISWP